MDAEMRRLLKQAVSDRVRERRQYGRVEQLEGKRDSRLLLRAESERASSTEHSADQARRGTFLERWLDWMDAREPN